MRKKPSFKMTATGSVETGTGWEWISSCKQWKVTTPYTRVAVLTNVKTGERHTFDYPSQAFQWFLENLRNPVDQGSASP